ncbi:DUF6118 family protein [Rhizobium pusense]|uniref:DUF6118 family protein n=1 Tax=Agrobacterium pusense TaxID=648995 RepID=UPI002447F88F|nr:DUF6118 family protein [Agrobacterium pusense]MDH2092652.1 DUF6118 family protein [Agrobacterium pusense]
MARDDDTDLLRGFGEREPEALEDHEAEAAAAFEALRSRVESLHGDLTREMTTIRKGVEYALDQLDQRGMAVDYSAEIGRTNQMLAQINERLRGIEQLPVLRQGAEHYARVIERSGESLVRVAAQQFEHESRDFQRAARDLAGHVAIAREARQQNQWLAVVGLAGVLTGILVVLLLSRLLPVSLTSHAAALVMGNDRVRAGQTMIETADPVAGRAVSTGGWVYDNNREAIDTCIQQMLKSQNEQTCEVRLPVVRSNR